MGNRAILVIDLQNDYFPGGKLPLSGIEAAAHNAARVIAAARRDGEPVIHVRHEFPDPRAPFFTPGSAGAQIHGSVLPSGGEPVILKNHTNAFRDTGLKAALDARGIERLAVVGAMTQNCIDHTVRAAADLGYQLEIVHDACATLDLTFGDTTVPAALVQAAFMAALSSYAAMTTTGDHLARRQPVAAL